MGEWIELDFPATPAAESPIPDGLEMALGARARFVGKSRFDYSAHCCLAPYWAAKLGKREMTAFQASPRGGVVRVRLGEDRVYLQGQAVTVMRGELTV